MNDAAQPRRRILVIDDNPSIHHDFRKILCPPVEVVDVFETLAFGITERTEPQNYYDLDSASQGNEGFEMVQKAIAEQRPYEMAFIDVRMPPGWDGVETTSRIWQVQPDLPIVLCTAYSDHSWDELFDRLGGSDRLIILKKPFENIEVLQLACSLAKKWQMLQESKRKLSILESAVAAHNAEMLAEQGKFKAIFENSTEGIFNMSPYGHLLSANPAFAKIYGYASPAQLLSLNRHALFQHHVDAEQLKELLRRLESTTMVRDFESEIRRSDGSSRWIRQTIYKVTGADDTLWHYQGFVVDISREKNIQKERDDLQAQLSEAKNLEAVY